MKTKSFLLISFLAFTLAAFSQNNDSHPTKRLNIGVFAPLYLDSVFSGNLYRYEKNFPRFTLQGFDFIQGTLIAADSFSVNNNIETYIYDTKSDSLPVSVLIENHELDKLDMIIGSVKDEDLTQLANYAKSRKIPFVSATYPNDGGIKSNPYYIILNTTLKSHCEAIFSYLLEEHHDSKIILLRHSGSQEDRVQSYFNKINKTDDSKPLLNIKTISLDSNYNSILKQIDTTQKTVIIAGSLDEKFAYSIASVLLPYQKKFGLSVIGMPNWENFNFNRKENPELKEFDFIYTSSYHNNKIDSFSMTVKTEYLKRFKGNPSDYTYKGFEAMYIFSRLLYDHAGAVMEHLSEIPGKVFSDFNFHPVSTNQNPSSETDYFENKHLFFLEQKNGTVSKVW